MNQSMNQNMNQSISEKINQTMQAIEIVRPGEPEVLQRTERPSLYRSQMRYSLKLLPPVLMAPM